MNTRAKVAASPATPTNNQQLIITINELCEATYIAKFLSGAFAREEGNVTLTADELYGLSNIIETLTDKLEKAVSELTQLEGACQP